ncbi:MAG: hypothetical protein HYZ85_00695, partial [Candidatus Omnitrophica bacterium]|nr:hypothetical protein [Candidatus Omnitrophota bacterium]
SEQRYRIIYTELDEIDWTRVVSVNLVVIGRHVDSRLNVHWGEFAFTPQVQAGNITNFSVSDLPRDSRGQRAALLDFASAQNPDGTRDWSSVEVDILSRNVAELEFKLFSDNSFGGIFIPYDDFSTNDNNDQTITDIETVDLTDGGMQNALIFGVKSGGITEIQLEITDNQGRVGNVGVTDIGGIEKLVRVGFDLFENVDVTKTTSVNFVVLGHHVDQTLQIHIGDLDFAASVLPQPLMQIQSELTQDGLNYFKSGAGIDDTTHFPYDNIDDQGNIGRFTQPTLIGFYLQILSDVVGGRLNNGMTKDQAIAEMQAVVTQLLEVQQNHGWNGLLPFLNLNPVAPLSTTVGLGDNANLAQSIAVAIGGLEAASLTSDQRTAANAFAANAESFLDRQAPGYTAFVDPTFGIFRSSVNSSTGVFDNFIDRLANEFRGAIAFLKVRYPSLPASVWNGLDIVFKDYSTSTGGTITNLAYFEGGAFQAFWPGMRNNELIYDGFRAALNNFFVTQADYAALHRIPGFLSAAQTPVDGYFGRIGIPQVAETPLELLVDLGSTYSLASAYRINAGVVLNWLRAIADQVPGAQSGPYGFFDSARSGSEIAKRFIGIDIAATVLSLSGDGPESFETYLINRSLGSAYDALYQQKSVEVLAGLQRTSMEPSLPPEFPDRSLAVFSHIASEGTINNFPINPAAETGVQFTYSALNSGFGGQFWNLDQTYDARANQLILLYSIQNSPQSIKIELKNAADQTVFTAAPNLINSSSLQRLVIELPNLLTLVDIQKVFVVIDQNLTQDNSGDFKIHAINFQHVPSSQDIFPAPNLNTSDVTDIPGDPAAQLFSSNAGTSLQTVSANIDRLNYVHTSAGDFSGISYNFDPNNSGISANLSSLSSLTFGVQSNDVHSVIMEIEDADGKRAIYFIRNVDITLKYYQFLLGRAASSIDLTRVKKINFVVDANTILSGHSSGILDLEIGDSLTV